MERARSKPIQKKLVGDLWYENEATVMFAETNAGKSIFAVQIADSISRGVGIGPLEFTSEAQPVVYFDFELNDRQFSIRYTIDGQNPYVWDDNFIRVELDPDAEYPMGNYCLYVCDQIETVMLEVNARAAIIDNITYLNDELEKSKAALPLMKQLKVIKQSEAAFADSVSHTFFPIILLFGGGFADIEEHNRPSKVVLAALLPTKRPQLTALLPSHRTDAVARSECSTTEGLH